MRADHHHAVVAATLRFGDDVLGRHVGMHHGINDQTNRGILSSQLQANIAVGADHRDVHDIVAKGTVEGLLSRLVVEDDHALCVSICGVYRLVAEVAHTAFDQGNFAAKVSTAEIGGVAAEIGSQHHGRSHVSWGRVVHRPKPRD